MLKVKVQNLKVKAEPIEDLKDLRIVRFGPWSKFEEIALSVPTLSSIDKRGPWKKYFMKCPNQPSKIGALSI